jgi:hypothetical protein
MTNITMQQWVISQYDSFYHFMRKIDEDATDKLWMNKEPYVRIGNFVVEVCEEKGTVTILNTNSGKCAVAHCAPTDEFSMWYGIGICWARYNHVKRPKFEVKKKLSKLKPHDIFSLYTGCKCKYEFVGTTSDGKYVGYDSKDTRKKLYSFVEGDCIVWE